MVIAPTGGDNATPGRRWILVKAVVDLTAGNNLAWRYLILYTVRGTPES